MVRTQIQLTEAQAKRLKGLANARGVSMAALIREAVDALPASDMEERRRRALAAVGRFSSGSANNAGEEHDRELAKIYAE
jgi:predicted DNA-binding protein